MAILDSHAPKVALPNFISAYNAQRAPEAAALAAKHRAAVRLSEVK